MKAKQATGILIKQKEKIEGSMKPEIWVNTTSEILKKIFPLSHESKSKHISDIYFYPLYERNPFLIEQQVAKGRIKGAEYMNEFIEEINNSGLEKSNEDNQIITLLKNPAFWMVIVPLVSGAFFLGNYFGNNKFDNEKNLMNENIKIQSSTIDSLKLKLKENNKSK